jgi:putative ABC transport system substrate-binding protein
LPDSFFSTHRDRILVLAAQHRLPMVTTDNTSVRDGGLMSYGVPSSVYIEGAASYVDRILRGTKPADLPVQAPTKFVLTINLKTAKALGLTVPNTLLVSADEVVE